jgi:MFS family permease
VFVTAGIFGEVFATANAAFLIGKMILGVGLGFYLSIGPLMAAEMAPVSLRGVVTSGTNLGICIGQLLSNAAIKGFGEREDRWAYRAPFALQWLFVLLIVVGLPFAPESPWYHIRKNEMEAARNALYKLYGSSTDLDAKISMMAKTVNEDIEATSAARWVQCFQGTNRLRSIIAVMVFCAQHSSGIVFVLGFSTYFFIVSSPSPPGAPA